MAGLICKSRFFSLFLQNQLEKKVVQKRELFCTQVP